MAAIRFQGLTDNLGLLQPPTPFLNATAGSGNAQFIIATHSPIILSCPEAEIFSFDSVPVKIIRYEETEHYRIYRDFMIDPKRFLQEETPE